MVTPRNVYPRRRRWRRRPGFVNTVSLSVNRHGLSYGRGAGSLEIYEARRVHRCSGIREEAGGEGLPYWCYEG